MSRSTRNPRWLWLAIAVCLVVSAASFLNALDGKDQQVDSAVSVAKDERQDKDAVVSDASTLAQQVAQACATSKGKTLTDLRKAGLCEQAEETKETIDDATDDRTPPPVVGPSQAQVNTGLREILAGMSLTGPRGVRGPSPTPEQIAAAFADYCSTTADCRGADGDDGAQGAPGVQGQQGDKGADAPVIVSSFCDAEDHIVLVFDNSAQIVVTDSDCRPEILQP